MSNESTKMSCLLLDGNKAADEDHFYELPQTVVKRYFGDGRYGRLGTIGDGSCFFHCICYATNANGYRSLAHKARQKVAHGLREGLSERFTEEAYELLLADTKSQKMPKAFSQMKTAMAEPKTWAEEIMIRWTSQQLGLNVVFLNVGNNNNQMYCGVHNKEATEAFKLCGPTWPVVVVVWVDHSHFELLCRLDDVSDSSIVVRPFFDPKDSTDKDTIQKLLAAYVTSCNV